MLQPMLHKRERNAATAGPTQCSRNRCSKARAILLRRCAATAIPRDGSSAAPRDLPGRSTCRVLHGRVLHVAAHYPIARLFHFHTWDSRRTLDSGRVCARHPARDPCRTHDPCRVHDPSAARDSRGTPRCVPGRQFARAQRFPRSPSDATAAGGLANVAKLGYHKISKKCRAG